MLVCEDCGISFLLRGFSEKGYPFFFFFAPSASQASWRDYFSLGLPSTLFSSRFRAKPTREKLEECLDRGEKDVFAVNAKALD